MNIDELNTLISTMNDPQLSPFGENMCSQTVLDSGELLYLIAEEHSLSMYLQAECLGSKASEYPELFEELLADNLNGGQHNNLRIAYEKETSAVLLCHDISFIELKNQGIELAIKVFLACTESLKQDVIEHIHNAILSGPKTPRYNSGNDTEENEQKIKIAIEDVLNCDDDEVLRKAMMNQEVFLMV